MKILIGHPAYNGVNASAEASDEPEAVSILRSRGVKLSNARKAVKAAIGEGFSVVSAAPTGNYDYIEISVPRG